MFNNYIYKIEFGPVILSKVGDISIHTHTHTQMDRFIGHIHTYFTKFSTGRI